MLMLPSLHFSKTIRVVFSKQTLAIACAGLFLSACASKNPLLDDSKTAAKPSSSNTATASTPSNSGNSELDTKTTKLSASQKFLWFFSPYRVTVQQGNFISQEMLTQIKVGMTRDQIRFLIGTPLLTDVFHGERWDYPFRLQKGSGETTTSRIALFFEAGKLARIDAGDLPTESDYLIRIAGPAPKD